MAKDGSSLEDQPIHGIHQTLLCRLHGNPDILRHFSDLLGNGRTKRNTGYLCINYHIFHMFGENHRRAGRKKWRNDHPILRQKAAHFVGQDAGFLNIDLKPHGLQTFGTKPPHNIAPSLSPMQMQQGRGLWMTQDQINQSSRIACRRLGLKAQTPRNLCCAVAHAKAKSRQGAARPDQSPSGNRPGLRRQDQRPKTLLGQRRSQEDRRKQRASNRADKVTIPRRHSHGKPRGLRFGPGDQNGQGAGLQGHASGVTCTQPFAQRRTMQATLTFLGIESSCDDTAAAVVRVGEAGEILSSVVEGQAALHAAFGGVVPEIAARAHAERLDACVERALSEAGLGLHDLDGIAVTAGPGLIGGVLSGVMLAKGLAAGTGLPLVGVNHLAGHALTPRLTDGIAFPYLMLLVSGGHCQFLIAHGPEEFSRIGGTIDDAPGEAFDKIAKLLGLAQPGGPWVEREASLGDPKRFSLPRPLLDRPGCDMSFSGLKTAVLRARDALIAAQGGLKAQDRRDLCACFQAAVTDVLIEKTRRALGVYADGNPPAPAFAVAGGVAANSAIRAGLETLCAAQGVAFYAPPLHLCTDNAAMIAFAGIERFRVSGADDMTLAARPRWPLDATAAPLLGSGKKGAKA